VYGLLHEGVNSQKGRALAKEPFPSDFMFVLTEEEKTQVVAKCDHLARLKYSPMLHLSPFSKRYGH
jgi:hypothetical protein